MWTIEKDFRFEASHQLPNYKGKCNRLHGHSWKGTVVLQSPNLQPGGEQVGMVQDYSEIGVIVNKLVYDKLDHWHLNDTTGLENPTSEELARWVFNQLITQLPMLVAVVIEETCTSRCTYQGETQQCLTF
jgi:6-pyruvoyltetrahydropterin/6-carboxytetrahydropterin synthase